MHQIYKILTLNFRVIYKITIIVINIIMICILLYGCSFSNEKQNKDYLLQKNQIKNINKQYFNTYIKYHKKITKKEKIFSILKKSGVNEQNISQLIKKDHSLLHDLKVNQCLSWKVENSGKLIKLTWKISDFQTKVYKKSKNTFLMFNIISSNIFIRKIIFIKKKSTFFKEALDSGLNQFEINNVIQALKWQVDFHQLSIGSSFHLVFSHNLKNKKNILLGIKLNNSGRKYYAIRASNGNFYDINGYNKKTYCINFLFLKKYPITSEFNLHRMHPITHQITHHLGVDFAMLQGTPVLATSNGKIIRVGFNKIAGLYIELKNKKKYITRYLHLNKILVKTGDTVMIGQKIALSGNTGRTTGPHLHYEIWINNHAINPMNKILQYSSTLTRKEKTTYLKQVKKMLRYLN